MGKKLDKLFWGLFFILGAVFILVSRMGYLKDMNVFTLILAVFLAGCFLKSLFHVEFTGMLFSLAFLAILFSKVGTPIRKVSSMAILIGFIRLTATSSRSKPISTVFHPKIW